MAFIPLIRIDSDRDTPVAVNIHHIMSVNLSSLDDRGSVLHMSDGNIIRVKEHPVQVMKKIEEESI